MRSPRSAFFCFVSIAFILPSCASDKAEELRELRPTSVTANLGPSISLEHRPSSGFGFRVYAFAADAELSTKDLDLVNAFWGKLDDGVRNYKVSGTDVGIAGIFYPFHSSAFHVGLGIENHSSTSSFHSDTTTKDQFGFAGKTRVSYSQNSNYLSIPVGWNWIWPSGFTFSLEYGPRYRLTRSTQWKDEGGQDVDVGFRNRYSNQKEDDKNIQLGGSGGFGFSF